MKRFIAVALLVGLAACGGGPGQAPRNLDNACSVLEQRPGYLTAMRTSERKWGVPVHVQMATIYQESKFISDARPPFRYALGVIPVGRQSSALGYSQALDATWEEYKRDQRRFNADRKRITDATDFMGWYMVRTQAKNGIPLTDARNQYLAYHEGNTGYARSSYLAKPWLVRIAGEIDARSYLYAQQLQTCRVRR
jgi:hypothetical protein